MAQFNHTLTSKEIDQYRTPILSLLSKLNTNKHRIMSQDYRQLTNHLQYTLNVLNNMQNVLIVEHSDPYFGGQGGVQGRKVVYNQDGTTKIINSGDLHVTGEDWEKQFDESLLIRPPSYMVPPQSKTGMRR